MAYNFHYTPTGTGVISGKEVLEQTEDAINDLGNTAISGVQEALDKAEQALTNSENAVDDAQTALNTANNAEGVAIQAQTDVGNLSGTVTNIGNRVTTAEGNISNLQGRMTTAEGNITNLQGRMTTAESNIGNLQTAVSTAQATANSAQQTATTARQQSYVFRYSSTALTPSSTNSNALLDNTDNLKVGDKVIDSNGVLFSITAIDTQNSTFTIGTALIDLAQDSAVVHNTGNETIAGTKTFSSTITGSISGNAGTATQFSANKSVTLTGDVTGTASSKAGWSVATTLANSGVTAGDYGPSANASPSHGGTFSVPYVTVDAKGRTTAASTKTITLPTYSAFTGASSSAAGSTGLVVAPAKGDQAKFLRGDATWQTISIPTVNNATLTIQKNGTTVNTFTANASSNVTANITVPTKVSDLTNDSGYLVSSDLSTYATKQDLADLVDSAPEALDTLNELSAALGDDPNFATTVTTALGAKANSADLATVATSGSYNDLSNKPTINNSTITIQKNGSTVDTFTTNGSAKTIDIPVPTKTSDLTNDSNFVDTSNSAVASGITSAKVTSYDSHIADTDIHVTTADKTKWNNGVSQAYVFRYSGTAVVPNSTIAYSTIDNTDNIKSGDKILDVDGKLFEITAVDTTNQTVTVGSALIDLALDGNVVHTSGNETITGNKTFGNGTLIVDNGIGSNVHGEIKLAGSRSGYIVADNSFDGVFNNNNCGVSILLQDENKPLHISGYKVDSNGRVFADNTNKKPVLAITGGLIRTSILVPENDTSSSLLRILSQLDYANGNPSKTLDVRFIQYDNANATSAIYSNNDNKTTLGANSRKWSDVITYKVNGVEPSSLSLPSDNLNDIIDISSYLTYLDGSKANTYIAPANGWISITMSNCSGIQAYITGLWGHQIVRSSVGGIRFLMPILKNLTANILIFGGTIDNARFIPCQGNV